ncbi:hypothetical protein NEOLEDRAFT_783936 [Neolentinus lepideus HHB14362 ss-1]|uniref:Secreted protein n=1 Tax=Neolentinus lepideus HHB14362 ss-1 TaxID=1314782 RepID=A0A165UXL9_9AGAM|nr:hypothetical protein NEOLEDRAFT_783936 [Neolentinus lepideus HHB14362 ss-1]
MVSWPSSIHRILFAAFTLTLRFPVPSRALYRGLITLPRRDQLLFSSVSYLGHGPPSHLSIPVARVLQYPLVHPHNSIGYHPFFRRFCHIYPSATLVSLAAAAACTSLAVAAICPRRTDDI